MISVRPYQECFIDNCNKKIYCKEMCYQHYRRTIKNGNPSKLSKYETERKIAKEEHLKAKKSNEKYYYTNLPCKRGHISRKFTKNMRCEACYLEDVKNHVRARKYSLQANYKISVEEYNKLLWLQNGVCAICKQKETITNYKNNKTKSLSVDHCHETGKIRGLLCHFYNVGIGALKHNPDLLRKAALYCEAI